MKEVSNALDSLEANTGIGAVIITGSEKAFAAGADIKEMQNNTFSQCISGNFLEHWSRVSKNLKPVIAAVNGYAVSKKTGFDYCIQLFDVSFSITKFNLQVFKIFKEYHLPLITFRMFYVSHLMTIDEKTLFIERGLVKNIDLDLVAYFTHRRT